MKIAMSRKAVRWGSTAAVAGLLSTAALSWMPSVSATPVFSNTQRIIGPRLLIQRGENIRLRIKELIEGKLHPDDARRGVGQFAGLGTVISPVAAEAESSTSWGVWVDGNYVYIEGDEPGKEFSGPQISVGAGIDVTLNERIVIGVSFNYDTSDTDNNFGGIVFGAPGRFETQSYGVGPYMAISLTDNLAFDASFTYSWGHSDLTDQFSFGEFDSQSWNVSTNLTGYLPLSDNLTLSPTIGLSYSYNRDEAYFDNLLNFLPAQSTYTGVLNFGATLSYAIPLDDVRYIEPSITVEGSWEFDIFGNPPLDTGLVTSNVNDPAVHATITGALDIALSEAVSVSFTGGISGLGRANYVEYSGGGLVSVVF